MLHHLKPLVEQFPFAANAYRQLRDAWATQQLRPAQTPHGFVFMGDPSMLDGRFEPDETRLVIDHLEQFEVFVDIGAHWGFFSCLTGSRGKKTVSFEPSPKNLSLLCANLQANGLDKSEIFPLGLSNEAAILTLYGAHTGASLLRGWAGASSQITNTIAVNTLDQVLGHRFEGQRLFFKMDIEGAEHIALAGATATLKRDPRPIWMVEICLTEHQPDGGVNPHYREVFERFWANGYTAYTVDREAREVTAADVDRWVSQKRRDFGNHNFCFK
ncbi:MAG: FkbM family methyltransferase [Myxococcales bacterium]|nr:FkbM family methyltransferase [Myxococcales bacterium]